MYSDNTKPSPPQMAEDAMPHGGVDAEISDAPPPPASILPSSSAGLPTVSLNIWPPSQRTRDAVMQHLIDTFSSPSVLTKRYGVVPAEKATAMARLIEHEAFDAANTDACRADSSIDDGLETLQVYSKEISKRMIEFVKSRALPAPSTAAVENAVGKAASVPAKSDSTVAGGNEEASPVERQSESPPS